MGQDHSGAVRLLWGPRAAPARGPRPALDLDRIARAGIETADAEGLGEVSMHRVAGRLGVTKMALYRYVPGKAELVALMADTAVGPCPAPQDPHAGWRARLEEWARRLLAAFLDHPWALEATVGPRVPGPAELSWLESAVGALEGTGLGGAERMDAAVLLVGHVRTIAQQARAPGAAGGDGPQLGTALGTLVHEHGERFPALAAALAPAARDGGRGQAWEFGLQRILDGLGALIDRRAR
ncbi:TetR/AcrR family transcriptional regulator [Nocardiopsis baichengensis]|uniref:TetR/AcrR family transcriptional regulator n=1 Tax=Nocardiopsis baichengensis TaxID=280240 RepID=UPI000345AA23|nr:TetR/AcrR family transcriptional regulator [Nocardiopsis baichengensis]